MCAALCRVFGKVIVCALALTLGGCLSFIEAERTNRGGYVDNLMDRHWMSADTSQMRTLRAYLLIGSIARLRRDSYYRTERETMVTAMNSAIRAANEVFSCAYSMPGKCVFFDERMVELETNLLKLLVLTISTDENEDLAKILNREMSKNLPAWKAVESVGKFADAFTSTVEFAANSGAVVMSLLKFGEIGLSYGRRIGALYRDMLELEMITVLQSLDTICAVSQNAFTEYNTTTGYYSYKKFTEKSHKAAWRKTSGWAYMQFYGWSPSEAKKACGLFETGHRYWSRGAGDLKEWRKFLDQDVTPLRPWIIPDDNAFIQASDLIWRVCESVAGGSPSLISRCLGRVALKDDSDGAIKDAVNRECVVDYDEDGRSKHLTNVPPKSAAPEGSTDGSKKTTGEQSSKKQKTEQSKVSEQAKKNGARVWNDRCRLILFWQTWEYRQNRSERANARLDWLSSLAPSVSHPVEARGWTHSVPPPPPPRATPWDTKLTDKQRGKI